MNRLFGEGVQLYRNKRRPTPRPCLGQTAMLGSIYIYIYIYLKVKNLLVEAWPFHLARGQPDSKINRGQVDLMMGDDLAMIW